MKLAAIAAAAGLVLGALTASHFTALRWSGKLEAVKVEYQQREHAAERAAADREKQWAKSLEDVSREAAKQLEDVRKSERAAADSRVRKAAAEYARRPAAADDSTPDDRARVLAELFADADERAERVASAYDEARVRGLGCERAYDLLRVTAE